MELRAETSDQGIIFSLPARKSDILRSISSAHASSTPRLKLFLESLKEQTRELRAIRLRKL